MKNWNFLEGRKSSNCTASVIHSDGDVKINVTPKVLNFPSARVYAGFSSSRPFRYLGEVVGVIILPEKAIRLFIYFNVKGEVLSSTDPSRRVWTNMETINLI